MTLELTTDYDPTQLIAIRDIEELLGFSSGWKTNTLYDLANGARQWAEKYTDRSFLEQTWTMTLDAFPAVIYLPKGRFIGLSGTTISYIDSTGSSATLTNDTDFKIYENGDSVRLVPIDANKDVDDWPNTGDQKAVVTIVWKAGYGTTKSTVPGSIIAGVKLAIQNMYCNEAPGDAAKMMLDYYKHSFAWQTVNR